MRGPLLIDGVSRDSAPTASVRVCVCVREYISEYICEYSYIRIPTLPTAAAAAGRRN